MNLDNQTLLRESAEMGFRPEIQEKVIRLILILNSIQEHPFLRDKLVLKGGTALNLFLLKLPRLSVDIDLNYVGQLDRDKMQEERPRVEEALETVCQEEGMTVVRVPGEHAGGKWRLRYTSVLGGQANLEMDLNYMFREPLWPVQRLNSMTVGSFQALDIPVLSLTETVAGKLAALFGRTKARDVFDTVTIFENQQLDSEMVRFGFILYGAMNRKDWRTIGVDDIQLEPPELESQLKPVLRSSSMPTDESISEWAESLVNKCRAMVGFLFPFEPSESDFLNTLLDTGDIVPEHLTRDSEFQTIIRNHPLLKWKSQKVKEWHSGKK